MEFRRGNRNQKIILVEDIGSTTKDGDPSGWYQRQLNISAKYRRQFADPTALGLWQLEQIALANGIQWD